MKNFIFSSLLTFLMAFTANAGFMGIECKAHRISQDLNKNIQSINISSYKLTINGSDEMEVIDGSLVDLYPDSSVNATVKAKDGKGNINVSINVIKTISQAHGHADIERDHQISQYQVKILASRLEKTHEFIGVCETELITTCGGGCKPESNQRDVL